MFPVLTSVKIIFNYGFQFKENVMGVKGLINILKNKKINYNIRYVRNNILS